MLGHSEEELVDTVNPEQKLLQAGLFTIFTYTALFWPFAALSHLILVRNLEG